MLKIYALLIGFFIRQAFGCSNICKYDKNNSTNICYIKAQDCLTLQCDEVKDLPTWIRQSNQTNVTLIENSMNYFPNSYSTNSFRLLTILSVQAIDSGLDTFIAIRDNNYCKFSVFAYDLENWNGTLSISGQAKLVNSTESFDVQLKTFNKDIPIMYKYQALPMEYLTFNDSRLESTDCTSSSPWLNCLEADFQIEVGKCVNNVSYTVGYGYDSDYSPVMNLMSRNYTHTILFSYPPQTKIKQKNIVFQDTDTSVELLCEIECANPSQNLVYEFVKLDNLNKLVLRNDSSNLFNYELQADEDVIEIICTVYNSIIADSTHLNESQTRFLLHSKSSTEALTTENFFTTISLSEDNSTDSTYVTSTGNSTEYTTILESTSISNSTGHPTCPPVENGMETWLIVVIAVACFLILVVVLLLIFLVYTISRRSGSYKKSEKLNNFSVELDKSVRQKQLNENLESNPVYAMTNATQNANQTGPAARSDQSQTNL